MTSLLEPTEQTTAVRRSLIAPLDGLEWRKSSNGEDYTLTGHAAVFDRWSEELWTFAGAFRERIAPGAFTDSLATKPDVRLLFNHDGNFPLARTKSKTLELTEDPAGLRVWARVAPTSYANDLRMAMQRGDIDQMSFAFTIAPDGDEWDEADGEIQRTVTRVEDLFDVSIVTFPAYPDTDVAMREFRSAARAGRFTVTPARLRAAADEKRMDTEDISCLAQMLQLGACYVGDQDEPGEAQNVPAMEKILADIAALIPGEVTETEPPEPGETEMNKTRAVTAPDAAQAETDPAGTTHAAPDDPAGRTRISPAPAETDPVDGEAEAFAAARQATRLAAQQEREQTLRLYKEMSDEAHQRGRGDARSARQGDRGHVGAGHAHPGAS